MSGFSSMRLGGIDDIQDISSNNSPINMRKMRTPKTYGDIITVKPKRAYGNKRISNPTTVIG